ncbi:MAG TPA: hypothetical protein VFV38_13720 [Ktedonobacteraceae bacterium]|nr:hypothetical protein [Ktedonobacteraceae bacterium]
MFYIALLFLILLGGVAIAIIFQNFLTLLSTNVHLTVFSWRTPGIPILLFFLLGACLGGLLLYVFSTFSARQDARIIKKLRARVEELEQEKAQMRSPSGALKTNFAPPVVPMPGFSPSGPLQHRQPPVGSLPQQPPSGPLPPGQPSATSQPPLPKLSAPSSLPNGSLPARQFPPLPQQGAPRPPFLQQ